MSRNFLNKEYRGNFLRKRFRCEHARTVRSSTTVVTDEMKIISRVKYSFYIELDESNEL